MQKFLQILHDNKYFFYFLIVLFGCSTILLNTKVFGFDYLSWYNWATAIFAVGLISFVYSIEEVRFQEELKKDLEIIIQNNDPHNQKTVNILDLIHDKKPFVIGFISFYSANTSFTSINWITLDKEYHLFNYPHRDGTYKIYDFAKGHLAPLNHVIDFSEPINIKIPPMSTVAVFISVV
jgi:hypothetical protein